MNILSLIKFEINISLIELKFFSVGIYLQSLNSEKDFNLFFLQLEKIIFNNFEISYT